MKKETETKTNKRQSPLRY